MKIECEWGRYFEEECIRIIEVADETSLYDLHLMIQSLVDFENDHLFEYFGGRHWRNRKLLFVEEDSWNFDYERAMDDYKQIKLNEVYPLPKSLKLFYHFDFGDDWHFKITKSRKKPKEPEEGVEYPKLIEGVSPAPRQYPSWDD